jgi:predicted NBD/HSP70 family sugar kinase
VTPGRDDVGQRSETVRRANLATLVRELHLRGPHTRSDLVAHTGLSRSAIRALVSELVAGDLVVEGRATPLGTPGRPSPVVRPIPEGAAVLALEIAVNSLAVALVGYGGHVFELIRVDRPEGHTTVDRIAHDLRELAATVRSRHASIDPLVGTGVAIVGLVRLTDGRVAMAPNLGWTDVPLGERLAATLGVTGPISVANDANLIAVAEARRGAAVGEDDVLFISGEVGVGGGIIVDGRPLTGVAGYAGEVGHIQVNPAGLPCGCGSVGCWETEIGANALLRRAGRPPNSGRAEVETILRRAEAGSPVELQATIDVATWVGFGLASMVNIFNPRLIVLGGLLGRMHPLMATTIDAQLDRLALGAPRAQVRIVPATLGVDAPLLGAAELAFEPLLTDPAVWLHRAGDAVRASA